MIGRRVSDYKSIIVREIPTVFTVWKIQWESAADGINQVDLNIR